MTTVSRQTVMGIVIDALGSVGLVAILVGAWSYDWRVGLMVVGIGCLLVAVTLARR